MKYQNYIAPHFHFRQKKLKNKSHKEKSQTGLEWNERGEWNILNHIICTNNWKQVGRASEGEHKVSLQYSGIERHLEEKESSYDIVTEQWTRLCWIRAEAAANTAYRCLPITHQPSFCATLSLMQFLHWFHGSFPFIPRHGIPPHEWERRRLTYGCDSLIWLRGDWKRMGTRVLLCVRLCMCFSNITPRRDPRRRRVRVFVVSARTRRHCALWQEVQAVGLSVLVSCVRTGPWLPLVPLKDVPPKCSSQPGHPHTLESSETVPSSHLAWHYH